MCFFFCVSVSVGVFDYAFPSCMICHNAVVEPSGSLDVSFVVEK